MIEVTLPLYYPVGTGVFIAFVLAALTVLILYWTVKFAVTIVMGG